jgi:homoserine O-acetyltransferase
VSHWSPGDPPGHRLFVTAFARSPLRLEAGGELSPVTIAYETWGTLGPGAANAVLVLHALTGDSHAAGPMGPGHPTEGWWDGSIGPGKAIDTDRFFVVCPNVLGGCQGTTGPSSLAPGDGHPYGSRFPTITIRDQVAVEVALADHLGIERWAAVIGGSMGGMRVLEWAVAYPGRVGIAVVVACGAYASAEQIALCSVQNRAIRADPDFRGGDYYGGPAPDAGMGVARRIGHLSYRSETELAARFGRAPQAGEDPLRGGRYAVESYLDHQAEKLARRFDANTYIALSEAMNHHDVGRGRGGYEAAIKGAPCDFVVAGVDTDRLYPLYLQHQVAAAAGVDVDIITSVFGHDAFLLEDAQVGNVISRALSGPTTNTGGAHGTA